MSTDSVPIVEEAKQRLEQFKCSNCEKARLNWLKSLLVCVALLTGFQLTVLAPLAYHICREIAQLKLQVRNHEQQLKYGPEWPPEQADFYGSPTEDISEVFDKDFAGEELHLVGSLSRSPPDQSKGVQNLRSKRATDGKDEVDFDIQLETQYNKPRLRHHGNSNHQKDTPGKRHSTPNSWDLMLGDQPKERKGKKRTKKPGRDRGGKKPVNLHLQADSVGVQPLGNAWEYIPHTKGYWSQAGYRPDPSDMKLRYWKVRDLDKYAKKAMVYDDNGEVEIKQAGLYFIYSQMLYYNSGPISAHAVTIKSQNADPQYFIQCTMSSSPATDGDAGADNSRYRTCHTSGVTELKKGDRVYISSLYRNRTVEFKKESCFWGLLKLK